MRLTSSSNVATTLVFLSKFSALKRFQKVTFSWTVSGWQILVRASQLSSSCFLLMFLIKFKVWIFFYVQYF